MAEVDLGVILNGATTSRRDFVGFNNNNVDTFSFRTITNNSNINISLTGMTGDIRGEDTMTAVLQPGNRAASEEDLLSKLACLRH